MPDSNTEQLAIEVLARIGDLEKNMKKATRLTGVAFSDMRRITNSATKTMENDMTRSSLRIGEAVAMTSTKIGALGEVSKMAAFQQRNLQMQLADVGQSLALGASPLQVLLQQGPQIAQIYGAGEGGIGRAFKETGAMALNLVTRFAPLLAVLAAAYAAYRLLASSTIDARNAIDEETKALAAQAVPASQLEGMVKDLAEAQKAYTTAIGDTATQQVAASDKIIAATKAEFEAKKQLFELELKRQQASLAVQRAAIAQIGNDIRGRIDTSVFTRDDGIRQGTSDPLIGDFTINASRLEAVQKTLDTINADPAMDELKKVRAEYTLNELAVNKMEEAMKQAWSGQAIDTGDATKSVKSSSAAVKEATDAWEGLREVSESVKKAQQATAEQMKVVADRIQAVASTTATAMGDIRRGFLEGGSAAEVFGNAAMGMLDRLASAIETNLANALANAFLAPTPGGFNLFGTLLGAGGAVAGGIVGGGVGVGAGAVKAAAPASLPPAMKTAAARPAASDVNIRLVNDSLNIRADVETVSRGQVEQHAPGMIKKGVEDYSRHVLPGDVKKIVSRPKDRRLDR